MTIKLALIKLGGSVITNKDKPLTPNNHAISNIVKIIKELDLPCILVHGGGSFGHYWSVKYDVHTASSLYDLKGISIIHESMIALNEIIIKAMIRENLYPYSMMPDQITLFHKPLNDKISLMLDMSMKGLIPITFGDVVYMGNGMTSILSGDVLMSILSEQIRPQKIIFTTNVDGIYSDLRTKTLIKNLRVNDNSIIDYSETGFDVTGGMQRKVKESLRIASNGLDVAIINGLFPERIYEVIKGLPFIGTSIQSGRLTNID